MNVLVIPEDFRKDQFVVGPLVRRLLKAVGKPKANVRVCQDPLLGGIGEAMKWMRIKEILDRYRGNVSIFLLLVDRDGEEGRRQALDALEKKAATLLGEGKLFSRRERLARDGGLGPGRARASQAMELAGHSLGDASQGILFRAASRAAWLDQGARRRPHHHGS
jgi:hypothetical protein